ncbi:hypothetical protein AAVH_27185 [Aphelenchoides avenae]|nr:hypothetical protein AAVH_27185 [Aphelenchus avenae]
MGTASIRPTLVQIGFGRGIDGAYKKELLKGIGDTNSDEFYCSQKFNMTLTIEGHDYVIPSDFLVDQDGTICTLKMTDRGRPGQFRIGEAFLLSHCHSLDIANNRFGFVKNINLHV